MSTEPKPGVIGSLPRTRPHRRSDKRAAPPAGAPPVDSQSAAEPEVVKAAAPKRATAAGAKPAATATGTGTGTAKPKRATKPKPTPAPAKPKPAAAKPKPAPARSKRPVPGAAPPRPGSPGREPTGREPSHGVLETAVQAAAELAEIGLHASARALRRAASRLPRP
ncbi:MAG TPA: hypothetical protein VMF14_18680 [Solirubrobacteraceae bacterium]|nr:hypothetical protein [Solirubrobacteraceae bacterium]